MSNNLPRLESDISPGYQPDTSGNNPVKSYGRHPGNNNPYKSALDPYNPRKNICVDPCYIRVYPWYQLVNFSTHYFFMI